MSKELKPCPFCGGKGELRYRPFDEDFFIKCEYKNWKCNTQTLYYETEEEAIEAWNTRASEVEMRERMKAILTGHQPRQLANNPIPPNVAPAYIPNSEVKE